MRIVLRLSIVAVLALLFLMVAPNLSAADPTGASPDDGLAPTCTYQTLGPGASIWLKIPYRFNYRLQLTLDAYFVGGIKFDVYPSPTASNPMGTGTYNLNEPLHDLNWEGQLQQNGFIYVLVTNTNPFAVQYRFCVKEKDPFNAPAGGPAPPDCAAICSSYEREVCRARFLLQGGTLCVVGNAVPGPITTPEGCLCCVIRD